MIDSSGVLFQFTPTHQSSRQPDTTPEPTNAGPQSGSQPLTPIQNIPQQQPVSIKAPPRPLGLSPRPASPNRPLSPNTQLKRPLPRFKPPFPNSKSPSTKQAFPWDDPFQFDPVEPATPPRYANAKNLKDLANPPEYYRGLPVEETPELPIELPPVSIDNSYVDRLFGDTPTKTVIPESTISDLPVTPIVTGETYHNLPIEVLPDPEEIAISTESNPPLEAPVTEPHELTTATEDIVDQQEIVSNHNTPTESVVMPEETITTPEEEVFESQAVVVEPASHPVVEQHVIPSQQEQHFAQPETPDVHELLTPSTPVTTKPEKKNPFDILRPKFSLKRTIGVLLIIAAIYGMTIPFIPRMKLEAKYAQLEQAEQDRASENAKKPLPKSVPIGFNPMMAPDGTIITPINTEFSLVIPSVGINASVLSGIDPLEPKSYRPALEQGVAHAKTSYLPSQNGTTYLFSHSTNFEWYIKDLNAIFYNVKNLKTGDYIVIFYQNTRYVYEYKDRSIVAPNDTSYLFPSTGDKKLILQTCWPPGSTTQRLLIFADLVQEQAL